MAYREELEKVLSKMTFDMDENLKLLKEYEENNVLKMPNLLLELVDEKYNEEQCLLAIETLLNNGYDPNCEVPDSKYNFIQNAIYTNYSGEFVVEILKIVFNLSEEGKFAEDFDLYHIDDSGDTIMHSAIYAKGYNGSIVPLYRLLTEKGFDSRVVDAKNETVYESMKRVNKLLNKFGDSEFKEARGIFLKNNPDRDKLTIEEKRKLIKIKKIKDLLNKLGDDFDKNEAFIDAFIERNPTYNYESLLIAFTDQIYDVNKCFLGIKTLLKNGVNPNVSNSLNRDFIQTAVVRGYGEDFVLKVLKEATKDNLKIKYDINRVDKDGCSLINASIYYSKYIEGVFKLYSLACELGFDSSIRDVRERTLIEAMEYMNRKENKFPEKLMLEMRTLFCEQLSITIEDSLNDISRAQETLAVKINDEEDKKTVKEEKSKTAIEKFGKVLTDKKYDSSVAIGRDKELKNLMISLAQEKKTPLVVGESGVGKTAVVEELAYRISIGDVPDFLKNRMILEVVPSEIVAGCKYVGEFEQVMVDLIDSCKKNNAILFIDEIHSIYGVGATESKNSDMASILKYHIERSGLKVVGTTTEAEYQEYFAEDALKRRFEKIVVEEPDDALLYTILNKVMDDYCSRVKLDFAEDGIKEKIIDVIMDVTDDKCRVYNDKVNNPDLAISIIDKAFAFAKVYGDGNITKDHFVESFSSCDRIYETARERAINMLKQDDRKEKKGKVLDVDFSKFRR